MISIFDARDQVLRACNKLGVVTAPAAEMSGRVLAEDIVASEDVPHFENSAVDGFAVRSEDVQKIPVDLVIVGTLAAGQAPTREVGRGEAIRIMTGAPIPSGADAVVMVENAEILDNQRVRLKQKAVSRTPIREIGSDVHKGDVVFKAGTVINAAGTGVLASINARTVRTFPKVRVALLGTGDELITDGSPLKIGQIRESNLTMLKSLVVESGCELISLEIVKDDEQLLEQHLRDLAERCDVIITSGGVSMGDFDVVKAVLSRIAKINWMQIAIKPAKPFAFGLLESLDGRSIPIFGLPGNPVSSMISFELLARPALRKMMGHTGHLLRPVIMAVADAPLTRKPDGKIHYIRVFGYFGDDGRLRIRDTGPQDSHQLAATALANGLAEVVDGTGVPAGEEVPVYLLG
jgi:molybdenum cofactor synthesis domain-containing protein